MRCFYVFLTFFFYAAAALGQDNVPLLHQMKKNSLSISGSLDGEVKVFYERTLRNRHALELGVGKKWSDTSDTDIASVRTTFGRTHPSRFYEGYLFSAAYKFYLDDKVHPWYISVLLLYKMYSYPTISVSYSATAMDIRKGSKDVRAGKLLFGKRFNFPIGNKISMVMDLNFGVGIRERKFVDAIYYSYDGYNAYFNDPPEIETENKIVPSFELGAKFGIGF